MQNKLQELTDKLYNEGLAKGKQEGEEILAKAKVQAEEIVAKAKAEAAAIVSAANKEAEDLKKRMSEVGDRIKELDAVASAAARAAAEACPYHIGIDVGSTTVKLAVLDNDHNILWAVYRRHHADVRATIIEVLREAAEAYPAEAMTIAITGSWLKKRTDFSVRRAMSMIVSKSGARLINVSATKNVPFFELMMCIVAKVL